MKARHLLTRLVSLREAAAIIFVLSAILPLLVFVSILNSFELLAKTEVQVRLFLALTIAGLGFLVFRRMMDRIGQLVQAVAPSKPGELAAAPGETDLPIVPGVGAVAEIVQISEGFNRLLENMRGSTERLEDLVFKLVTLNEMVELAARIPKMQDLLTAVLERTMRTVRARVGSIMLLDQESQTLRVAAARGLPEELLASTEVKVGEGPAGVVAQLGEPVLVSDIETDPQFGSARDSKYGRGSLISMPLRVGDRIIGVINLAREKYDTVSPSDAQPFTFMDLKFLNTLMTYVAYALDNARLLEETRQSAKQLQEVIDQLRAAQEQLVRGETSRAIGVLASGVAHHLNNLLAVVLGRIEFLLQDTKEPRSVRSLKTAQRASLDAADVVRQLRSFGQTSPISEAVPLNLNQVAQEVFELTRRHWQDETRSGGTQIRASVELGSIPTILGDPLSLREVLTSLFINAVKALPDGGQITVRTWASPQGVLCSVADTGVGMSKEVRERALQPFFTTKGPRSRGLGLSVAYAIVQAHGGDLAIDSAEGRGTTVTICLPVRETASEPELGTVPEGQLLMAQGRASAVS